MPDQDLPQEPSDSQERDRRRAVRYAVEPAMPPRLIATLLDPLEPATVRNLSRTGIGLAVGRWFEPESILFLELLNPSSKFLCRLQLRVAYMMEDRSGEWRILGGAFLRDLGDDELRALLA